MEFQKENNKMLMREFNGNVGFAIGTGRCGTTFLAKALKLEQEVASVHERNRLNETFHRYCKWYQLPVDHEGFLHTKESEIRQDLHNKSFSFEASAYLSLSVVELYQRFGAKFILMVRSPERMINAYIRKGWYDSPMVRANSQLALGYQDVAEFHHFLGRIVPSGKKFQQWQQMNRIGKLAWYWNVMNASVLEQFEKIPETYWRVEKLEALNYKRYLEITQFLGFQSSLTQKAYNTLAKYRHNELPNVPTIDMWNAAEIAEFEIQVAPVAKKLGYEYRVDRLPVPPVKPPMQLSRITRQFQQLCASMKKLIMV